MPDLSNVAQILTRYAAELPDKIAVQDLARAMTYSQWNERACRLANALRGIGLAKGDRFAVLAYNCVEWMEIYAAAAKADLIAVPVNFRLLGAEIRYLIENSGAKALIVQSDLLDRVEEIRASLPIAESNFVYFGNEKIPPGYQPYEQLIARATASEPQVVIAPQDTWTFMYTSGTTGAPKGAMRSQASDCLLYAYTARAMGFGGSDTGLLVMPMCHANSLWFSFNFTSCGGTAFVYSRKSFDPEHLLRTLSERSITFTSLVPTHYTMMLGLPTATKAKYNVDKTEKLLISSAPARRDTKRAIMEHFRNSKLFEGYGSTEAGWVTMLPPEEQLHKLGSIGRELEGTGPIKLLDSDGKEVPGGEVGELYFRTPYVFQGYWNMPEQTAAAFRGAYCSVGDMARRDEDGYYFLVDRKSNMIISGGENVYPSEVESMLGGFPKLREVAVIGVPHDKWGEAVHAVIVLRDGEKASEGEVLDWCKDKIAGYKRPRSVSFVKEEEIPRTATGKIQHRLLRQRYAQTVTGMPAA
jgi:fatty-acyl-CoA synthase